MARLARVAPLGISQHIIQRGNNRQICFSNKKDMGVYLNWLKESSIKYQVDVHAWVLMSNHIHLLCTPWKENAVSRMMQSMGRLYVRYFNHNYERTGTLWEGRYKSCLVQNERYLLEVYRYIEQNPVRAGLVEKPEDYRWSSYGINALDLDRELQSPHPQYLALGKTDQERRYNYRKLVMTQVDAEILEEIRLSVNKGVALGNKHFTSLIESQTKQRVTPRKPGRPRKSEAVNCIG